MVRAHRPTTDTTVDDIDEDASLPAPTQQEIDSLINGHMDIDQLVVKTRRNQHNYSKKLGTSGERVSFVFTRLARRFAGSGLLLELMATVIQQLLETHKISGASRCLVVLSTTDGSLEYPYSSSLQPIDGFGYAQFLDGLASVQQSNRFLGVTKELTIDITSFRLRGGKGKTAAAAAVEESEKHPRTKAKSHSRNMMEFLKHKYGILDVDRIKPQLKRFGNFTAACFGLSIATALVFPEKEKLQNFKR
jgi:hypothetical protein